MSDNKNPAIDAKLIKDLAKILDATSLTEIEVEAGTLKIRVARETKSGEMPAAPMNFAYPTSAPMMPTMPAAPVAAEQPAADSSDKGASGGKGSLEDHPGLVTAPTVGTAYLAPEPGAATFVSKGDSVNEGDTILIIEAMKVMNEIPATKAGVIKEILVDNGQPVEFGAPLFIIE